MKTIIFILCQFFMYITFYGTVTAGVVFSVTGKSQIKDDNKTHEASPGDVIYDNSIITTDNDSTLTIKLHNNSGIVTVKPETVFYISSLQSKTATNFSISLFKGVVSANVTKKSEEYFNVATSSIVLGVRGTTFDVAASGLNDSIVVVSDGRIEIKNIDKPEEQYFVNKDSSLEKIAGSEIKITESDNNKIDLLKWMVEKKKDSLRKEIALNELNLRISRYFNRISITGRNNDTMKKMVNDLKESHKKLLGNIKIKKILNGKSGLSEFRNSIERLNKTRYNSILENRELLDVYRASVANYLSIIDNLDQEELKNPRLKKFIAIRKNIIDFSPVIDKLESDWRMEILGYNEDAEIADEISRQ